MDFNKDLETLCSKLKIGEGPFGEIKDFFEKSIIKVFHEHYSESSNKTSKKKESSESNNNVEKCSAKKANGEPCTFKAKENGKCKRHSEDSKSGGSSGKERTKCGAIIESSGNQCSLTGTNKPEGSGCFYCKRHADKWETWEKGEDTLPSAKDKKSGVKAGKGSDKKKRAVVEQNESDNESDDGSGRGGSGGSGGGGSGGGDKSDKSDNVDDEI